MRLFVGLTLPAEIRARLVSLKGGLPDARWVAEENLHLSLRFIGEVTGGDERDINLALQSVTGCLFDLTLSDFGAFERRGRVHTVWAGVEKSKTLSDLRDRIESVLVRAGLEPEHRKFTPHVTLARMQKGDASTAGLYLESHAGFQAPPFTVEHFTLFESRLNHSGAKYTVLADYPLETVSKGG
jgi:2'-5' RNA ligase